MPPVLRKQIAFSQDNLTALAAGIKETFNDLAKFQPSEQFGRNIEVLMLEMTARLSLHKLPAASQLFANALEVQVSTSATFGDQDNIMSNMMMSVQSLTGATTVGPTGIGDAHVEKNIGNLMFPLSTVRIPGALYLNAQMWNLAGNTLVAGDLKSAGACTVYYRQLG